MYARGGRLSMRECRGVEEEAGPGVCAVAKILDIGPGVV